MTISKFLINVPQQTLDDLKERLRRTRWADEIDDGWTFGTEHGELRALVDYWAGAFDWRRQEEAINRFAHFRADVNGVGVHFIHERGVGDDPLPIILTHGYPDSILRFAKIIPMLTHPERTARIPVMRLTSSRQAFPVSASPTSRGSRVRSSTLAICGIR